MTLRITESMRAAITIRLLQHRFERDKKALKRREHDLAMKVHRLRYSAAIRKHMNDLPDGWLPTAGMIQVHVGSYWRKLYFTENVRVQFIDQHGSFDLNKTENADLAAAIQKHFEEISALDKQEEDLRKKTIGTLAGFSTINRLVAAWPEIKPFVDQLGYDSEKKSLPAVIPADLNASLGLQAAA